jgi:hypothetical protein
MTMRSARVAVVIVGILVPYAVRLLPGGGGVGPYVQQGLSAILFLGAFNVIAWGSIVACSILYRHPAALLGPALLGFGYVGWGHYTLDLSAGAQAGVAVVFIPVYALPYIAVGAVLGYLFDWWWRPRAAV